MVSVHFHRQHYKSFFVVILFYVSVSLGFSAHWSKVHLFPSDLRISFACFFYIPVVKVDFSFSHFVKWTFEQAENAHEQKIFSPRLPCLGAVAPKPRHFFPALFRRFYFIDPLKLTEQRKVKWIYFCFSPPFSCYFYYSVNM